MKDKVKFAFIGAGSVSFCPETITDILKSELFKQVDVEICLMDKLRDPLDLSFGYCKEVAEYFKRKSVITATTDLQKAVDGADFVITAIEVNRYHYWSMDFHIPRRFGFRQIYGENGGPGGMFHFLRNVGPLLEIAKAMGKGCPDALMLNYTNPEAKLIEAVAKLTKIKTVGLCHGVEMGMDQVSMLLGIPKNEIEAEGGGLNHFGWFTSIRRKSNGEDLYPLLREREKQIDRLWQWDNFALSRLMLCTFGLWPYPGTNHIGEYISWSDELLASAKLQFYYNPIEFNPWKDKRPVEFVYSISKELSEKPMFRKEEPGDSGDAYAKSFTLGERLPQGSAEYGIPIAEAVFFDKLKHFGAVNVLNHGFIPNVPDKMAVEVPALADGKGIHPKTIAPLPAAVAAMISQQGAIHQLLIEAYQEKSKNKLLQALLIDPTLSNYYNAVELINVMCEMQKEILPELR